VSIRAVFFAIISRIIPILRKNYKLVGGFFGGLVWGYLLKNNTPAFYAVSSAFYAVSPKSAFFH